MRGTQHFLCVVVVVALLVASVNAAIPRACSTPSTSTFPFCDTKNSIDFRVKNLISLLNDTDKPNLLTARLEYTVPRLGIPEYSWGANCIHGIRALCGTECATVFPNPVNLGATFNMSIVYDMAQVIGLELRSLWLQGVSEDDFNKPHVGLDCWSPTINVNRDPRWGRNVEVAGEDPYLLGQYAVAYTKGLQEGKLDNRYIQVVSTLKHWAAYSLESWGGVNRHNFNAIVSAYDFVNTYSPAFKAAIQANARGVMCSYNSVNGIPACASPFLNNTLRGDWKFTGYVTSDTDAVGDIYQTHHYVPTAAQASALAVAAGTDINSGDTYQNSLGAALKQGLISKEAVDLALYRTFKLRFELGLFDPIEDQPYWHVSPTVVNTPTTQQFNLFATQQSLVLLKNTNRTLPFPRGASVAVVGPLANDRASPLGNYNGVVCKSGNFDCVVTIFEAIQRNNTKGTTVYQKGCDINSQSTAGFAAAVTAVKQADYVVLALGLDSSVEAEGLDRVNTTLPGVQEEFAELIVGIGKPTVVVLINGGALSIEWLSVHAPAILEAFYPGFQGGPAISSVVFGDYNPGGKMPYTTYTKDYVTQIKLTDMSMTDAPGRTYKYFKGTPIYPFGFGISYTQFSLVWQTVTKSSNKFVGDKVTYTVNVTNIGKVAGDEVALAYFKPVNDTLLIKQLFGFQRVHLGPSQSTSISFVVDYTTLQIGDANGEMYNTGEYVIQITNGVDQTVESQLQLLGTSVVYP